MLKELFTGKDPFHGISRTAVSIRLARGCVPDRPTAEATCNRLTDAWWVICMKCWQPIHVGYSYQFRESKSFVTRRAIVVIIPWQVMLHDSLNCIHTIDPVKPHANSDYTSLECKSLDMDSGHTQGCEAIATSDISRTIDIGAPFPPADSLLFYLFHSTRW